MALVSIVTPVYHNAASLPDLLARFQALACKNPGDRFEFIFIDDGSRDNSFDVLQTLAAAEPRVCVLKLSRNFGSNAAVLAGLDRAQGDAVVVIAADLQDPPELIHDMLGHWRQGRKVVLAARESRQDPFYKSIVSDLFYALFRRWAIKTMPKRGFDFFLADRQVVGIIKNIQESNAYLMGLILWVGFDPLVIHYHRREREQRYGRSMWSFFKRIKYFIDCFVGFSYIPVRLATILGLSLSFFGLLYAIIIVVRYLFFDYKTEGWASTMVVLLVVSGAQMLMIGILGEYLWRNLDETRRRPRFIVERTIESQADVNAALANGSPGAERSSTQAGAPS